MEKVLIKPKWNLKKYCNAKGEFDDTVENLKRLPIKTWQSKSLGYC